MSADPDTLAHIETLKALARLTRLVDECKKDWHDLRRLEDWKPRSGAKAIKAEGAYLRSKDALKDWVVIHRREIANAIDAIL